MEVVDLGALRPDLSYEEGVRLCVKLKLVETMQHGDQDYIRMTRKGVNVVSTLMMLMGDYIWATTWIQKTYRGRHEAEI